MIRISEQNQCANTPIKTCLRKHLLWTMKLVCNSDTRCNAVDVLLKYFYDSEKHKVDFSYNVITKINVFLN